MAQFGSALDWGSSGRRFKSCQPDTGQRRFPVLAAAGSRPVDPFADPAGCQQLSASKQQSGNRAYSAAMSADLTARDAIELLLTAKNQAVVHYGQVTLTVEQVDQIVGALGGVGLR